MMVWYREAVGLYARGKDVHMIVVGIVVVVHEIRLSAISGFRHELTGKVGQLVSRHHLPLYRGDDVELKARGLGVAVCPRPLLEIFLNLSGAVESGFM